MSSKKPRPSLLMNLHERDGRGGSKVIRSGATRDTTRHLGAPPTVGPDWSECPRCRGTGGGPNPFVPERTCKKCNGMGFIP